MDYLGKDMRKSKEDKTEGDEKEIKGNVYVYD